MEKDMLKKMSEYLTKVRTIDEIKKDFDISEIEVMTIVHALRNNGFNIVCDMKDSNLHIVNMKENNLDVSTSQTIVVPKGKTFKVLVISDTRLCSKYQQLSILNELYRIADREGIDTVFHCGDISEGIYSSKNKYSDTVFRNDTNLQAEYIIENYPLVEGVKTLFITGNQDDTHLKTNGVNIGRLISEGRSDMIFLGNYGAVIKINASKTMLRHPTDKIPYTVSYKQQQFMNSIRSEDKVDVLLNGHYLQAERLPYRDMYEFSIPSLVATTPFMSDNSLNNNVGAFILEYGFDEKGNIKNIIWSLLPYYVTNDDDYKKTAPLRLKKGAR